MRRAILLAVGFCLAATPALAADWSQILFGHKVEIKRAKGQATLSVDGRALLKNDYVAITEITTVKGVGVAIGETSDGSNRCDAAPFVISFPSGAATRFDGPMDVCALVDHTVERKRILFSVAATPGIDGQRWAWAPARGFSSLGTFKHVPDPTLGWAALRERKIDHPSALFDYAEVAKAMNALLGRDASVVLPIVSGVGSGSFKGDVFVGSACEPHMCGTNEAFVAADIAHKKVFAAWKLDGKAMVVRPAVGDWPQAARDAFEEWAKSWK